MKKIVALILLIMTGMSCKKTEPIEPKATYPFQFHTVAILGNSITYSPQNLFGGWKGNWGMAATSAQADYVHLLTAKMKNANPFCTDTVRNIMAFEENWQTYNLDSNLGDIKSLHPDLVILRIGEDVPRPYDKESFGRAYKALVDFFGPKTVVLGVGSFWPRDKPNDPDNTDEVMAKYAPFVSLAPLWKDGSNHSPDKWPANPAIGQHPNDKGMGEIADLIWETVQQYKPVQ